MTSKRAADPGSQPVVPLSVQPVILAVLLSTAVFVVASVYRLFETYTGHDQSWYLTAATRVLHGTSLYGPQLSETNPPLIIWLSLLPVFAAHATGLSDTVALRVLVLVLIAASTAWCASHLSRQLRRDGEHSGQKHSLLVPCVAAVVCTCFSISFINFGQREQLVYLLALPYLLAAPGTSRTSPAERMLLGFAAGVAVCLKPQQVLALLAAELFLAVTTRSLRRLWSAEVLTLAATGAVYLLLVRTLTPEYLTHVVPDLVNTYWAFKIATPLQMALKRRRSRTALLLVQLAATSLLRKRLELSRTVYVLLFASLGAVAAFDLQGTAWPYQGFPADALQLLAGLFLIADLAEHWPRRSLRQGQLAGIVAIPAASLLVVSLLPRLNPPEDQMRVQIKALVGHAQPGTSVLNLSPGAGTMSVLEERRLTLGSRFVHLWMLPAIARNLNGPAGDPAPFQKLSPSTLTDLSTRLRQDVAEDLEHWRPQLVLVERCTTAHTCIAMGSAPFDILAWFEQDPRFAADWSSYRLVGETTAYRAYQRADPAQAHQDRTVAR